MEPSSEELWLGRLHKVALILAIILPAVFLVAYAIGHRFLERLLTVLGM